MKTIKISVLDAVVSKCVRTAENWTCSRCRKQYPENSQGLHASHLFGRAKRSTRWLPLNLTAHCHGCHSYLTANPWEFSEWMENHLGREQLDRLRAIANTPVKFTKQDMRDILADYKAQLKTMQPGDDLETPAVLLLKIREAGL